MNRFARLFAELDATTSTSRKVRAMEAYFRDVPAEDAAWAVYFLSGRRPRRLVPARLLRETAAQTAGIAEWLFEESYSMVGDLAETVALLLEPGDAHSDPALHEVVADHVIALRGLEPEAQQKMLRATWSTLSRDALFVYNKMITGGFRVGVSQRLLSRGLSGAVDIEPDVLIHRLQGRWEPTPDFYQRLVNPDTGDAEAGRPYPFCLAHAIEGGAEELGEPADWRAEWKWDGIRAQLIRREGATWIWSRGGELITDSYPEVAAAASGLPDGTVLDGELLAWKDGVLPFGDMQRRIGRKKVSRKLLNDVPVVFMVFDCIETDGTDVRHWPLDRRQRTLHDLLQRHGGSVLRLGESVPFSTWEQLQARWGESRGRRVEGLMLKSASSEYAVGRPKGLWWKWKVEPLSVDAVLIYAQAGHGRRSGLYSDYTFAVWDGDQLVPFAKAYSGLTDAEIRRVDRFVRNHTRERFGPVRSVEPELVFEIGFEGIWPSKRHKSGLAVRFPRMLRWREDKRADQADTLETLRGLAG